MALMAKARARANGTRTAGVTTLRKRAEFLRVRKGARWATAAFVLEAKARGGEAPGRQARFGFTVTKQIGKAVERNRIRRRFKAAVRLVAADRAKGDFDYVLIARRPALTAAFGAILADLEKALEGVHCAPAKAR